MEVEGVVVDHTDGEEHRHHEDIVSGERKMHMGLVRRRFPWWRVNWSLLLWLPYRNCCFFPPKV